MATKIRTSDIINLMPEQVQQPTPQPQVSSKPQSTNWKKIGLTVLIIVVVAGLIAGVYWFFVLNKSSDISDLTGPVPKPQVTTSTPSATPSAKKDETADWNVYKDENISLRYPKSWGRYDFIGTPSFSVEDPTGVYPGVVVPTVLISESPNLSVYGVDLTGLLNSKIGATWDSGAKHYEKLSNLLVDDYKAVWIRQSLNPNIPASGPAIDHVYIQKDNKVYEISLWTQDTGELNKYPDILNQIIAIFKFLD